MIEFTIYQLSTGNILRSGVGSDTPSLQIQNANEGSIIGLSDDLLQYVDLGSMLLADRTTSSAMCDKSEFKADGIDTVTISEIAAGTLITINGVSEGVCNDGVIALTSQNVTSIEIQLDNTLHLANTITINAV